MTVQSLTALKAAYARGADYARDAPVAEKDVSEFWADILGERANYPSFDEMLLMRRGFRAHAELRDKRDELQHRRHDAAAARRARRDPRPRAVA